MNASSPTQELAFLLSLNANKNNLVGYWNFYPQRYTASSLMYFIEKKSIYKKLGIPLQVFVALQRNDAQGPWQYNDKLPSIEMHRDLTLTA
ncbi:MupG family TIM beta-alpha barrel fold protein [Spiroplasma citri]|nr:MupG family TIM beta-alpha barrel fold protein [Spiroplasma citri]